MTILSDIEKKILDDHFIKYQINPTKARFIQAVSNIMPEFRVIEILGESNNICAEKCQAYEEYIEEIFRDAK